MIINNNDNDNNNISIIIVVVLKSPKFLTSPRPATLNPKPWTILRQS